MKRYLLGLLFLSVATSHAQDAEKKFEARLAETIAYVDQHENEIWPGFRMSTSPIVSIIQDIQTFPNSTHLYAHLFKPKHPDWQRLNINGKPVYYMDHDAYNIIWPGSVSMYGIMNIDDQESFVYFNQEAGTDNTNMALAYLTYSRFESSYRNRGRYDYFKYDYSGFRNTDAVKLNYLELNILTKYLTAEKQSADDILKDALAVHYSRAKSLDAESGDFQENMQITEHVPAYVAWKALNLKDRNYPRSFGKTCDVSATSYNDIINCDTFYHSLLKGFAYGRALDTVTSQSWKLDILSRNISMEEKLVNIYGMNDDDIIIRTQQSKANPEYGYAYISKSIDNVLNPYLDEVLRQERNYTFQPGIELQVNFPQQDNFKTLAKSRLQFDHDPREYQISTRVTLFKDLDGGLGYIWDACNYLNTDFTNHPYVYHNSGFAYGNVDGWYEKFKLPSDAMLVINGKKITVMDFVNAHKRVFYKTLKIETPTVKIDAAGMKGILDASNGTLKLKTFVPALLKGDKPDMNAAGKALHDKLLFGSAPRAWM